MTFFCSAVHALSCVGERPKKNIRPENGGISPLFRGGGRDRKKDAKNKRESSSSALELDSIIDSSWPQWRPTDRVSPPFLPSVVPIPETFLNHSRTKKQKNQPPKISELLRFFVFSHGHLHNNYVHTWYQVFLINLTIAS